MFRLKKAILYGLYVKEWKVWLCCMWFVLTILHHCFRFKDVVECDRILVKAFESGHEVASFRASKLSDDFYHLRAEFERRKTHLTKDDLTRDPTRDLLTGRIHVIQ